MNRLLVVLVLIVAGIAAVGYYRGWFGFSTSNAEEKKNFTITVDQDKIQEDKEAVQEKVKNLGKDAKEKTGAPVGQGNKDSSER